MLFGYGHELWRLALGFVIDLLLLCLMFLWATPYWEIWSVELRLIYRLFPGTFGNSAVSIGSVALAAALHIYFWAKLADVMISRRR